MFSRANDLLATMISAVTYFTTFFEKRDLVNRILIISEEYKATRIKKRQCEVDLQKLKNTMIDRQFNISSFIIRDGKNNYIFP